jgi:hypothetical protein
MGGYNYQRYMKREAEETSGNEDYVDESIKSELSLRFEPSSNATQECDCRYSRSERTIERDIDSWQLAFLIELCISHNSCTQQCLLTFWSKD